MSYLKKMGALALVVMLSGVVATGCGSNDAISDNSPTDVKEVVSAENDNYTIKLGYYNCDHMTAAAIGKDAGIFEELGLSVDVTGNGKIPTAMAAGQMDAGYIGFTGLNRAFAKGAPIFVGANNHDGGSYYLVVSNDIEKPEDLIGQPLGIGATPELDNSCWPEIAKELGIPLEGENYQGINFDSDQAAYLAMKTGNIKGYMCCDPWGSMAEYEGTGKIMGKYLMPGDEWGACCVFALNKDFTNEHPELAKKLVLAHTKSLQYIYENPIKAAEIFADNYNVPLEVAQMTIYKKTVGEGRTLSWKIDDERFKHQREFEIGFGHYTEETAPYDEVVMTKFLDESGAVDFDEYIETIVDPLFPLGVTYEEWLVRANELNM